MGIFVNVGRDPPEPGVAPFVSANDKPVVLSKPVSGDAAEQRLKTEVMQLPPRDRRRLKDVLEVGCGSCDMEGTVMLMWLQPEVQDPIPSMIAEYQAAKQFKTPSDAGAGGKTSTSFILVILYTFPPPSLPFPFNPP